MKHHPLAWLNTKIPAPLALATGKKPEDRTPTERGLAISAREIAVEEIERTVRNYIEVFADYYDRAMVLNAVERAIKAVRVEVERE